MLKVIEIFQKDIIPFPAILRQFAFEPEIYLLCLFPVVLVEIGQRQIGQDELIRGDQDKSTLHGFLSEIGSVCKKTAPG